MEAIWAGRPPKTSTEQIQTCIWQLRRVLAPDAEPDVLIERTAAGYALRVEEDQVDAYRFTAATRRAHELAARGDADNAVTQLRTALATFRGRTLDDVHSPYVQSLATKWDERRLMAIEERIELELDLGSGRELVDELTTLVQENPWREVLCGQLMRALEQTGRRADALAVYRTARERMVDELGLEPGADLADLHGKILAGESTEPRAKPATPALTPAQLLADTVDFVGRGGYTEQIVGLLTGRGDRPSRGMRICSLLGRGGVGKTTLALHAAHEVRHHFPDGQLYARLGGAGCQPVSITEVLRGFLGAFGMPDAEIPPSLEQRAAKYRSLVADRHVLVVLDDVGDAEQLRPLLPAGAHTAVLTTSRTCLADLPGMDPIEVDTFTEDEAVALLTTLVGAERADGEAEGLREIAGAAGYLPLLVRAAGAKLKARPHISPGGQAKRLRDPARCLDELNYGALDLRATLAPSVCALPEQARDLWLRLGEREVVEFIASEAAEIAGTTTLDAERQLDILVDRRLVDTIGVDPAGAIRYRLDPLMRCYAGERAARELATLPEQTVRSSLHSCAEVGGPS